MSACWPFSCAAPTAPTIFKPERIPTAISCDANALDPRRGSRGAAAVRIGAGVALRFRCGAADAVSRADAARLEFRRPPAAHARDFVLVFVLISVLLLALLIVLVAWLQLRRWVNVLIGDIRGKRFRTTLNRRARRCRFCRRCGRCWPRPRRSSGWKSTFARIGRRRRLKQVVHDHLNSSQVIIVSNREPYIHNLRCGSSPVVQVPASGMVTALEPIMRACSGVWVAHGAGPADRDTVDRFDQIRVPPDDPAYTLRRVWLTSEQEQGYYYGFSNEGLWPLCHLAYVRPAFRPAIGGLRRGQRQVRRCGGGGGQHRQSGDSDPGLSLRAAAETHPRENPQGDDIAVLAHSLAECRDLRRVPVEARDPAAYAVGGYLGLSHALSLPEFSGDGGSVRGMPDRSRTHDGDIARACVPGCRLSHFHRVAAALAAMLPDVPSCRAAVRERYQMANDVVIGLGVERWDFTKGIIERFQALEALLDKNPRHRGRISLLQIAAPSRSTLPAYQALQEQTYSEVERINAKFARGIMAPYRADRRASGAAKVFELYRAADFCLVNSLHDGMNLVAKEFVAARDDEDGVLILSTFAGASRELAEAVLINPFDVNETAEAMEIAMRMGRDERRDRMSLMRRTVKENNVYRWAGRMLMDAARIRQRQNLPSVKKRYGT
jgi:trehalose 6-phosphate synthase/phosphatase